METYILEKTVESARREELYGVGGVIWPNRPHPKQKSEWRSYLNCIHAGGLSWQEWVKPGTNWWFSLITTLTLRKFLLCMPLFPNLHPMVVAFAEVICLRINPWICIQKAPTDSCFWGTMDDSWYSKGFETKQSCSCEEAKVNKKVFVSRSSMVRKVRKRHACCKVALTKVFGIAVRDIIFPTNIWLDWSSDSDELGNMMGGLSYQLRASVLLIRCSISSRWFTIERKGEGQRMEGKG